jgi:PKD repeat protein
MGMDRRSGRAISITRAQGIVPRWTFAVAMAAGLLLAIPASGHASTDALDQSLPASAFPSLANSTRTIAQTFTAGTTGQIDKVSLTLETHSQLVTGWLEIRPVNSTGAPSGGTQWPTTISPIQFNFPFGNQYHDFAISPAFRITAGTQYAIVWTRKIGIGYWWGTSSDAYSGGQGWLACQGCAWTPSTPTQDLGFKTWVASAPSNVPPVIAADHPAVAVGEGSPAGNTGTYSDPNGRDITISASSGAITKSGTSNGTWSWSAAPSDEEAAQTTTITADDGSGLTATTSFQVSVTAVAPIVNITAPGSTGPEGTPLVLTAVASSPSAADNTVGFNYAWNVTKNGNPYRSGSGVRWQFATDDEGTFVVTLKATDDGGMSASTSVIVTGMNVRPADRISGVTTSAPLVITPQEVLGFSGDFTDPGVLDSHTARWNFGDGLGSSSSFGPSGSATSSASHAYTAAGTYQVSLTVTDDDGGTAMSTTTVVVLSPEQALTTIRSYVQGISTLNSGQKNSLIAKLNAASAAASRGDATASHNLMSAFLNEVRADVQTGKISSSQETTLTGAIHAVEAALGTYNRMLQWWPLEP